MHERPCALTHAHARALTHTTHTHARTPTCMCTPPLPCRQGIEFMRWCKEHRNCIWTLDEHYAEYIEKMTPPNVAEMANGRACAVFTW